jgi:hypothetical protein
MFGTKCGRFDSSTPHLENGTKKLCHFLFWSLVAWLFTKRKNYSPPRDKYPLRGFSLNFGEKGCAVF